MLKLIGINKIYKAGDMEVHALKNINLEFRESELVAVLGPSGCGKTTMLNIVGGLDKYTSGDLIINGISTKEYVDSDWDAYRNSTIGFVFQNYNLISHLTVIENVELALTLSGVSASERRARAEQALKEVGLETQFNKKPNQLSGGQMQRVAIARALVNNPDIVLADEPTGALDSVTSVQIMELLKEVAKTRLVIMVTHNGDLADRYANRIIRLLDGEIISDTNPIDSEILTENVARRPKKTSMSFITAFKLSLKNLFTKKLRTFVTAFAGSIGIIGVALILALSSGFSAYIEKMQTDTLSSFPLTITSSAFDVSNLMSMLQVPDAEEYPEAHEIYVNKVMDKLSSLYQSNDITDEYVEEAIKTIDPSLTYGIVYTNGINFNIFTKQSYSGFNRITRIGSEWVQLVDNNDFINSQYDVLAGKLPTAYNELVLCVDEYNQVTDVELLQSLGILSGKDSYTFDEIMNLEFKLLTNDAVYSRVDTGEKTYFYEPDSLPEDEYNEGITLKIVGIVRVNQDTATGSISGTVGYHKDLQDYVLRYETENPSEIVTWQKNNPDINCFTGNLYLDEAREENPTASDNFLQKEADKARVSNLASLGAVSTPQAISIYPVDFESKELIKAHLDAYNETEGNTPVYYSDMMGLMVEAMNVLVDAISYVLIAFTSISLVVSSIMIGVIISVSVLERTKEIGILKAIGARKKDISRVFNAESLLVGFAAGALGVIITLLLSIPLNILLSSLTTINGLVALNPWHALLLVAISMLLTFIAGLVPSRSAAKKDAVVALRSE
mgnify:FL=1